MTLKSLILFVTFLLASGAANAATLYSSGDINGTSYSRRHHHHHRTGTPYTYAYTVSEASDAGTGTTIFQNLPVRNKRPKGYTYIDGSRLGSDSNVSSLQLWDAAIVQGDRTKHSWNHLRPTGVANGDKYLAIYAGGSAKFSLNAGVTNISFLWGSVSNSDYVSILNGDGARYTITGEQILRNALNCSRQNKTSVFFSLTDLAGIKELVLTACGYCAKTMEIANFRATPIPAAVILFGSALGGLGFVRRRKMAA